jgi:anti-anti-sigma regulatory factor
MFLATTNKTKKLLHLSFIGHVTAEELRQASQDMPALLADLPREMNLLVDLERLETMDADCAEQLGKSMELHDQHGVGLLVRVIPDPTKDIGLNILTVFHYRNRPRTVTCETMLEAARALSL